jgi:hypothetical protein
MSETRCLTGEYVRETDQPGCVAGDHAELRVQFRG